MAGKDDKKKTKRPTALKRDIQNEKRRGINRQYKSQIRTAVRVFEDNLKKGDSALVQESLNQVYSLVDGAVKRGLYKRNKASRLKSRFCARAAAQSA